MQNLRNQMRLSVAALAAGLVLNFAASGACASVSYLYTGPFFNVLADQEPPAGIYDSTNRVTASFTLSSLLPANFAGSVVPIAFTFSDGRVSFDESSGGILYFFDFSTDSFGEINSWNIVYGTSEDILLGEQIFGIGSLGSRQIETFWQDVGYIFECLSQSCIGGGSVQVDSGRVAGTGFAPGKWVIQEQNDVPEPATLALVGLGLAGLGFSRRKQ